MHGEVCFAGKQHGPSKRMAERYSMLRKLTFREPDASTLELVFAVADLQGAPRVVELGQLPPSKWLQRVIICPCAATDLRVSFLAAFE